MKTLAILVSVTVVIITSMAVANAVNEGEWSNKDD